MELAQLEDDIVTQILTVITTDVADVLAMPEDDNGFKRPMQKGKVVVAYQLSEYKDTLSTLPIQQPESVEVVITLQSRTLRGTFGIYNLFKLVKQAVLGFTPSDCEAPITGKWFGTPELGTPARVDEVWTFEYHIKTRTVCLQAMDVDSTVSPDVDSVFVPPNPLPLQGLDDTTPNYGTTNDLVIISLTEPS